MQINSQMNSQRPLAQKGGGGGTEAPRPLRGGFCKLQRCIFLLLCPSHLSQHHPPALLPLPGCWGRDADRCLCVSPLAAASSCAFRHYSLPEAMEIHGAGAMPVLAEAGSLGLSWGHAHHSVVCVRVCRGLLCLLV